MTRARGRDADMTQGNILRQYIDFALPLTVGLLFQQLYSAVDSIVVGNFVGETALGAVGSTGNIINMLIGVCNGLSLGAGAVISQAYGAKNHERISKAVHTTMLMTFLLCIVATAVGVAIVKPSLQLMRTPDSMLVEATEYLTIYFEGIAGLLIYNMAARFCAPWATRGGRCIFSFSPRSSTLCWTCCSSSASTWVWQVWRMRRLSHRLQARCSCCMC